MASLASRLIVGTLCTVVVLVLISLSHIPFVWIPFSFVIALIVGMSLVEFYRIPEAKGYQPKTQLALILSGCYVASVAVFYHTIFYPLAPALVLLASLVLPFVSMFKKGQEPLVNIAVTIFGIVYLTVPLTTMYQINYYFPPGIDQSGPIWILFVVLVTKMSDTVAYFVGSKLGKKKLAPYISPNKTVEGAIGGLIGAVITSVVFSLFTPIQLGFFESILIGIVMGVLAQLGDLSESLLKRDGGIKDSNNLPGLGGMLDIVDSTIFTAPFIYLYLLHKFPECMFI